MKLLDAIYKFFSVQTEFTLEKLNSTSKTSIVKRLLASTVTWYACSAAATIALHKFLPHIYVRIHRYGELRPLLEFSSPGPAIRHVAEVAFDVGVSALAYSKIPFLRETFASPLHVACWWRGSWSALLFANYGLFSSTDLALDRKDTMKVIRTAPASVIAACLGPSGNDIGTSLKSIFDALTGRGDVPPKRALLYEAMVLPSRLGVCWAAGKTIAMTNRVWLRGTLTCVWFCVDVFLVRSFLMTLILDRIAPYAVDSCTYELTEQEAVEHIARLERQQQEPQNQHLAVRPFENEEEERAARLLLLGLDSAEDMQFVIRFCNDVVGSDLCRGSARVEAARLARFAELLQQSGATSRAPALDEDEMQRVASVYEAGEEEFELHHVDEDHADCIICLEPMRGKKVASFRKCGHTMCFSCIAAWLAEHSTCPYCNDQMIRQQSSAGGFEPDAQQQQQQQQDDQQPREQLHGRLMRMLAGASLDKKHRDAEWGPLQRLFYVMGRKHGAMRVKDLRTFAPETTLGASDHDSWHLAIATLAFCHSNWDNRF